jgi:two-component system, cell cycle response regulator DivK
MMREPARAALQRLTLLGGPSLTRDLSARYVEQTAERIDTGRVALRDRQASVLAAVAHGIRSSSAQLGAVDLVSICESLEDSAEASDFARAAKDLEGVAAAFAEFRVWLADAIPSHDDELPREGERANTSSAARERVRTIAVIEDNADNRLLMDAILGDLYVLEEYATGTEALAAMPARRPALVLLDVSLPGMDGLEVLARIRHDPALGSVPVVAVTAHAMAGDRERYLAAGFDGYVPKPIVDERALIDTIEGLLPPRVGPSDASWAEDGGE